VCRCKLCRCHVISLAGIPRFRTLCLGPAVNDGKFQHKGESQVPLLDLYMWVLYITENQSKFPTLGLDFLTLEYHILTL
jgi:hypothetical protein